LPRASSRGGSTRSLNATSQKTLLPVKTELSRREPMRTKRRGGASCLRSSRRPANRRTAARRDALKPSRGEFHSLLTNSARCCLGAGAMCLQRNAAVDRLVAHKKGRLPAPSTPRLTDPTIAAFSSFLCLPIAAAQSLAGTAAVESCGLFCDLPSMSVGVCRVVAVDHLHRRFLWPN
jgi:hypothetical protein